MHGGTSKELEVWWNCSQTNLGLGVWLASFRNPLVGLRPRDWNRFIFTAAGLRQQKLKNSISYRLFLKYKWVKLRSSAKVSGRLWRRLLLKSSMVKDLILHRLGGRVAKLLLYKYIFWTLFNPQSLQTEGRVQFFKLLYHTLKWI